MLNYSHVRSCLYNVEDYWLHNSVRVYIVYVLFSFNLLGATHT